MKLIEAWQDAAIREGFALGRPLKEIAAEMGLSVRRCSSDNLCSERCRATLSEIQISRLQTRGASALPRDSPEVTPPGRLQFTLASGTSIARMQTVPVNLNIAPVVLATSSADEDAVVGDGAEGLVLHQRNVALKTIGATRRPPR